MNTHTQAPAGSSRFRPGRFLWIYPVGFVFLILQLAVGTAPDHALYFSLAIVFGLLAVLFSWPWHSAQCLLTAAVVLKVVLFGIVLKLLWGEATDQPLRAPADASFAAMLTMLGLCLACLAIKTIRFPQEGRIREPGDARWYFGMWLACLIFGYGAWWCLFLLNAGGISLGTTQIREQRVGGLAGVLNLLVHFKSLAISSAIFYANKVKWKSFPLHPCFVIALVAAIPAATLSTSKLDMMEPFLYIVLPLILLHGFANRKALLLTCAGFAFFYLVGQPFTDYARQRGGRTGTAEERAQSWVNMATRWANDPSMRAAARKDLRMGMYNYLPESIANLERFAMYAQSDHLIAGTGSHFTGWKTITWGFEFIPPRFLYRQKPVYGPGNYLAHIAGDPALNDVTTQMSYGLAGNFYNAFGHPGVFLGTFVLFLTFWLWIYFWFGRLWEVNLWSVAVFGYYQHHLAENNFAGVISLIPWFPFYCIGLSLLARVLIVAKAKFPVAAPAVRTYGNYGRLFAPTEAAPPLKRS